MAAVSVSGYVPLRSGFTSYSFWLSLNCLTSSFTASPSWPVMACQKWISVLASAGAGMPAERGEQGERPGRHGPELRGPWHGSASSRSRCASRVIPWVREADSRYDRALRLDLAGATLRYRRRR